MVGEENVIERGCGLGLLRRRALDRISGAYNLLRIFLFSGKRERGKQKRASKGTKR